MKNFVLGLGRNVVTLAGAAITTAAAIAFVFVLLLEVVGAIHSPYIGIFGFVVVPTLRVVGLLLIPRGRLIEHYQADVYAEGVCTAKAQESLTHLERLPAGAERDLLGEMLDFLVKRQF